MLQYIVTDIDGWQVNPNSFEDALERISPDFKVGDTQNVGSTIMKAYVFYENNDLIARMDVSYRQNGTAVLLSGEISEEVISELIDITKFEWEQK